MKWVRKKSSNQASSRLPTLSQVFPMSWFSKFKQMSSKSEPQQTKAKRKSIPKSPSLNSLSPVSFKPSRLHRGELCFSPEVAGRRIGRRTRPLSEMDGDDDFWRLSFGGESFEGKKSKGPLRSVWYDSDDELEFPFSSCHSCRSVKTKMGAKDESQKFTDMVSDIRKLRNSPVDVGISPENFTSKGLEFGTPSKKILKDRRVTDRKSRKTTEENGRSLTQVKRVLDFEPVTTIQPTENENSRHSVHISSSDTRKSNIKTEEENGKVAALNSETTDQILAEESDLEWKKAEDLKIEKLMLKSEKQRKSPDKSRELQRKRTKQGCKVRVNSPRTPSKVEVCKIKALEDMKKAKMKMKTKTEAKSMDERTDLESLAVVKCSFNPQKDFRDSMVEMISENGISRPEEMEDLLACYLSLNSDEFHDLIIKVFRQVWFDLNQACLGPELQKDHGHNDCK